MKAVILAAGEGLRMHPLTLEKPKSMLLVLGKPLLHHIWESLPSVIDEVVLVVGYKGDAIKSYFGSEYLGKKITYVFQKEKTGTAHALLMCREHLNEDQRFLLLYADDLHDRESIEKCLAYDRCLMVSLAEDPRKFGVVEIGLDGSVIDIEEKPENPKSNLVATGIYVLDNHIFDYEPVQSQNREYYLTSIIRQLTRDYKVFAEETAWWHPVSYPEDLKTAEEAMLLKIFKKS